MPIQNLLKIALGLGLIAMCSLVQAGTITGGGSGGGSTGGESGLGAGVPAVDTNTGAAADGSSNRPGIITGGGSGGASTGGASGMGAGVPAIDTNTGAPPKKSGNGKSTTDESSEGSPTGDSNEMSSPQ